MEHTVPPQGYHKLADLMGQYSETAIFRRFSTLSMLSILSLQAELVELQDDFRIICREDNSDADSPDKDFSRYFHKLRASKDGVNDEQLQQLRAIRMKLAEYNATVLQAAQMMRLNAPAKTDLNFLRDWLGDDAGGNAFLQGSEAFTWALPDGQDPAENAALERDFFTLHKRSDEQDLFSEKLSTVLLIWWIWLRSLPRRLTSRLSEAHNAPENSSNADPEKHEIRKTIDSKTGIIHYADSSLVRFNNIVVTVLSSALPILAIVALYFIPTRPKRIGAMAGFTMLFAISLACFTNARRLEIFASTSAFAAVEVVFIGTVLESS